MFNQKNSAPVISVLSWWRGTGCASQSMVSVSDILVLVEVTTTTNDDEGILHEAVEEQQEGEEHEEIDDVFMMAYSLLEQINKL